jgi:hypothetical protein
MSKKSDRAQLRAQALAEIKQGQAMLALGKEQLRSAQEQIKAAQRLIDKGAETLRLTAIHYRTGPSTPSGQILLNAVRMIPNT